ncbi:hypothetical protein ACFQV2_39325 [Actinokineospora soli]|uniref:Uncharacterized protein n=1 Tax=Actinokineospora soli TaxID=1048753 RepID=A0ABW2TYQ5_9PSEU
MSDASRYIAGAMLLSVVGIEFGGYYLMRIVGGKEKLTEFQQRFARAGHAHAGVLVTLGLVCLLYADAADLTGALGWGARLGVPVAALLIPGGFFFSSMGRGVITRPNRLVLLIGAGAVALAAGVVSAGTGLLIG